MKVMMQIMKSVFALWLVSMSCAWADASTVTSVRISEGAEGLRLIIDLDKATVFRYFTLEHPDRVVVDLTDAKMKTSLPKAMDTRGVLKSIRTAPRNANDRRIVLDVNAAVKAKAFVIVASEHTSHRLIVELVSVAIPTPAPVPVPTVAVKPLRDIVVAIDAGHGGEDPGARGHSGTWEKNVALQISKQIAGRLSKEVGMRAVLVRDGDYFVSLRERMARARREKADLFVSIHADAFNDASARGSSVYVLSDRGASDEASRWLAERENAADLVGGVTLDTKDDVLASVLLDLSQTGTLQASAQVAERVLMHIGKLGSLHNISVQNARFVVLKSPDVPSMLVETAFISNPEEEQRLNDAAHQEKLAQAITDGVKEYFSANPLPGTRFAELKRLQSRVPELAVSTYPQNRGKN